MKTLTAPIILAAHVTQPAADSAYDNNENEVTGASLAQPLIILTVNGSSSSSRTWVWDISPLKTLLLPDISA